MNTLTTLPAPPNGDSRYSIVTLARLLCVPPAVVDSHTYDDDAHSFRMLTTYINAGGEDLGDCWLHHSAAERIAAELPFGLLARRIKTPADVQFLQPEQVVALANHLVNLFGATS